MARRYYGAMREMHGIPQAGSGFYTYRLALADHFETHFGDGVTLEDLTEPGTSISEVGSADEQVPGRHRVLDSHPHVNGFDRCHIKRWTNGGGAVWYVSREEEE